jgi:hypothetical protein
MEPATHITLNRDRERFGPLPYSQAHEPAGMDVTLRANVVHQLRMETLGALVMGSMETNEAKFTRLAAEWRAETKFESSPFELTRSDAYFRIVGMGWDAVPTFSSGSCESARITGSGPSTRSRKSRRSLRAMRATSMQWCWHGYVGGGSVGSFDRARLALLRTGGAHGSVP